MYQGNTNIKQAVLTILMWDKVDFNLKSIISYRKGHYM